jgi:glycosyltransferase involved in cell wall biosynthesis
MTTIGVHTHITNPLNLGYLAYLGCIESWAKVVDKVVVVDGGSTDGSIELLSEYLGSLSNKVRIISPPEAFWGSGDDWCFPQIAINRQIGLEYLNTDWAIHVDADHVVDPISFPSFLKQLEELTDKILLNMWVGFYYNGLYYPKKRLRAWILNLAKIKKNNLKIGYGIECKKGIGLDYPICLSESWSFKDPVNNNLKYYFRGSEISPQGLTNLECLRYGHFFFNQEQCIAKCLRIEKAISRFINKRPRTLNEIKIELNLNDIVGYEKKDKLITKPHPVEIKRIIEKYYKEGMMGGAIYKNKTRFKNIFETVQSNWYKLKRITQNRL